MSPSPSLAAPPRRSSSLLDKTALSCPRPLPNGLELTSNGTFRYQSCRRHRATGALVEGTCTPSLSATMEEEDAISFQQLVSSILGSDDDSGDLMLNQLILSHLSGIASSRRWDLRLASIEFRVGNRIQIYLINGTCHEIDAPLSSSKVVEMVSRLEWDRVLPTYSVAVAANKSQLHHRITWHPYNRLSLRMGRRQAHPECRRVVETVCTQWLAASSSGKQRSNSNRRRRRSLSVVGPTGKTTVLRQLLRTLIDYHSHLRVGVISETGELYGMEGVLDIPVPMQRQWIDVVLSENIQVLVVDVSTAADDATATTMRDSCEKLARGGVFVASSGQWGSADLVFYIQHKAPWYRLVRKKQVQQRTQQRN
jgi:hypothetical protein